MQTQQTVNEGLKRAYLITITADEIAAKIDAEIKKVAPQVRMPGFRPGKVPANLVRKMHGPAIEQDALNKAVQEGVQALLAEMWLITPSNIRRKRRPRARTSSHVPSAGSMER